MIRNRKIMNKVYLILRDFSASLIGFVISFLSVFLFYTIWKNIVDVYNIIPISQVAILIAIAVGVSISLFWFCYIYNELLKGLKQNQV